MTADERDRMYELCGLIQTEKDHDKFLKLVRELNDLFEREEGHLEEPRKS